MIYTLVHYRPDGHDYCRGCHMGSSSSEMEIKSTPHLYDAARSIAEKQLWNQTNKDLTYADWETTILIDGYTENDNPAWEIFASDKTPLSPYSENTPDFPYSELEQATQVELGRLQEAEEERVKLEAETKEKNRLEKLVKEAAERESQDQAEWFRLKEKYGDKQ